MKVICNGRDKPFCESNLCTGNIEHERETRSGWGADAKFCTEWGDCIDSNGEVHKVRCVKVKP